jgi:hypothetical protein
MRVSTPQLATLFALVLSLMGCEDVPDKLCHDTGNRKKCCVVTTGQDTWSSSCVATETECRDLASGNPYTTNVSKDTDVKQIRSCVTKWKKEKFNGLFGLRKEVVPAEWEANDLGPLVAVETTAPSTVPVTLSDDPVDCKRTCEAGIGEFCKAFESAQNLGSNLKEFRHSIQGGVALGTLSMDEVHRIFEVTEDPCQRSDLGLSNGQITSSGIGTCLLELSIQVGQKQLPIAVEIPPQVTGTLGFIEGDALDSVVFGDPANSLSLTIGDKELNKRWGGSVRRLQMTSRDLLISTEGACVRLGLGTNAVANMFGDVP